MTKRKWLYGIIVILVILIVASTLIIIQFIKFGYEAKAWLAERHSENFIVDSVQYSLYQGKIAHIHPESNPKIVFTLYYSKEISSYIYDYYGKSLEFDTNQQFQKVLNEFYTDATCSSAIYLKKYGNSDFIKPNQGRPVVWEDINGTKYVDWLWIHISHKLSAEDYSKLYQIIQYGNKKNFDVHYVFYFSNAETSQDSLMITTQQSKKLESEQDFFEYVNQRIESID